MNESVLIIGVGSGLSASLARLCASKNMTVILAARNIDKLKELKEETNATTFKCDASNIESVSSLFKETDKKIGTPNLVIYNPSVRLRGNITELDPEQTQEAINVTCFAPLDRASKPNPPVPENKSKQDLFCISNWSQLKSVSFALSVVGLRLGEALKTIR